MKNKNIFFASQLCFCIILLVGSTVYCSDTEMISSETILPMLQYNENSIQTYQGTVQQIQYSLIEFDENNLNNLIYAGIEPQARAQTDTEFIHDLGRGKDYWATMRKEIFRSGGPIQNQIVRRNGNFTETLAMNKDLEPTFGSINIPKDSYYLGHAPRNFRTQSGISFLTSIAEDGVVDIPLSQLIKDKEHTWIYDGEFEVDGHPCIKIATLHSYDEDGNAYGLTWVWLGKDVNLNIIKQQAIMIEKDLYLNFEESAKERSHESVYDFLDELEVKPPHTLVVNSNYKNLEGNIWIAQEVNSYIISLLYPERVENMSDYDAISRIKDTCIHTQNFENAVLTAYHTFKLDMNSLVINEPVDPAIFETSVIPEGFPVTNYIFGVSSETIDEVLLDENLFNDTIFDENEPEDLQDTEIKAFTTDNDISAQEDLVSAEDNLIPKEKGNKAVSPVFIIIVVACAVLIVLFTFLRKLSKK